MPQPTDIDATINDFETMVFENLYEKNTQEKIQDFMETDDYKNSSRELYQKWLKVREKPHYGEPPEFIDQIKKLYCFDTIETWQ